MVGRAEEWALPSFLLDRSKTCFPCLAGMDPESGVFPPCLHSPLPGEFSRSKVPVYPRFYFLSLANISSFLLVPEIAVIDLLLLYGAWAIPARYSSEILFVIFNFNYVLCWVIFGQCWLLFCPVFIIVLESSRFFIVTHQEDEVERLTEQKGLQLQHMELGHSLVLISGPWGRV